MTAGVGERVNDMVARFNASQSDYVVRAVRKGSYLQTFKAAIAGHHVKQPPHIVHVSNVAPSRCSRRAWCTQCISS